MHCILAIPGALTRNPDLIEKLGTLALPALQRLLARGRGKSEAWNGKDAWLLEMFSVERQDDWPSAPYALLGSGEPPGDACWAHADPVSLRADRDRLLLADAAGLNIRTEEAQEIAAAVDKHFGDVLRLKIVSPECWYARLAAPPQGETTPLAAVAGGQVTAGHGAMGWHVLMNEIQMLLYEHPVNLAREERGELPLNGIWLSGAGRLAPASTSFHSVACGSPLAKGLARHAEITVRETPPDAGHWLSSLASQGVHLCVQEELFAAAKQGNVDLWLKTLEQLERSWFAPLLAELEAGRIGMLTLKLGSARTLSSIETVRQDLRRFWRRPQPLDRTLAAPEDSETEEP